MCLEESFRSPELGPPGMYERAREILREERAALESTEGRPREVVAAPPPPELDDDSETMVRLREEYEADRQWLMERGVEPFVFNPLLPVFTTTIRLGFL